MEKIYQSQNELREAIENYIYYYNHHRIKEKLNWKSPVEFRQFNQKNCIKIEWKNPLYKKSNFLGSLHLQKKVCVFLVAKFRCI